MGLRDRIKAAAAKRKANKGKGKVNDAQARQVESVAGTNPTGGASTTANTKKSEGSKQKRPETAAMFRAKKKAELDAAKRAQVAKQKSVTADRAKKAASKPVESTKKKKATSAYSSDTRTPKQIEAGNKRAISNRTNKGKAKVGETFKYTDKYNKTQSVEKKKK